MILKAITVGLGFLIALPAIAQNDDKVIYQQDGLWVLSFPWSSNQRWCEDHNLPGRAIPVSVFYSAPHEQRMAALGKPLQQWVYDAILPSIQLVCGAEVEIDYITLAMYRKPSNMAPSGLVSALKSNKPPPWDSITVKVSKAGAEVTGHRPLDAQYHLNSKQLAALDPRSAAEVEEQLIRSEINDYVLHQSEGLKFISWFSQPGPKWCQHSYVSVIAEYDNEAVKKEVLNSHPAAYLQEKIIPEIRQICPQFPNYPQVLEGAKQLLVFKFRPKIGRIADERINPDKLNFQVFDNGGVKLLRDKTYERWLVAKQNASVQGAVTQMVKLDNDWLLSNGIQSAQTKAEIAASLIKINESLFELKGFKSLKRHFEKIKQLRRDALNDFDTARNEFQKAEEAAKQAKKQNSQLTYATINKVDQLIGVYQQHTKSGEQVFDAALGKLKRAESLIIKE